MAASVSNMSNVLSTEARSTGKRYAEIRTGPGVTLGSQGFFECGITPLATPDTGSTVSSTTYFPDGLGGFIGPYRGVGWSTDSFVYKGATNLLGYSAGRLYSSSATMRIAMDLDAGRVWLALNGGAWVNDIGVGDPETGANPTTTLDLGIPFYIGSCAGNNRQFAGTASPFVWQVTIRTEAAEFEYAIPAGFSQFT